MSVGLGGYAGEQLNSSISEKPDSGQLPSPESLRNLLHVGSVPKKIFENQLKVEFLRVVAQLK